MSVNKETRPTAATVERDGMGAGLGQSSASMHHDNRPLPRRQAPRLDVFRQVREMVSAEETARFYGLTFDRRGWCRCPFHNDTHASMSFRDGRFRCWACGASGDAVDLVSKLFGLDPLGAVRKLNDDFRLGLPIDRPQDPVERREAEREAQERRDLSETFQAFEAWRETTACQACGAIRRGSEVLKTLETMEDLDRLTEEDALAIRSLSRLEYAADCLDGAVAQSIIIFRERGQIGRLCERISRQKLPKRSGRA